MRTKINNNGYSLVELLIAIFILGIVMIGIVMIMRTTSISYRDGNAEITAQTEAQIVANQIEELLVDTSTAYGEGVYNTQTYYMVVNGDVKHLLLYDHTGNTIKYKKCAADASMTADGWSLMAEYVSAFDISGFSKTVTDPDCDNKVTVNVTMETAEGYSYSATKEVYFRNAIENADVQKISQNDSNDSNASDSIVEYVEVKRYDIIDLKREYGIDINAATTTVSGDLADKYDFVKVIWNTNNENKKIWEAITDVESVAVGTKTDYLTTGTSLNNTLGDSVTDEPDSKYYITAINESNQRVKLIFYTEAVSFNVATSSGDPNAGGYAGIRSKVGDAERYIAMVETNGIDLAMMLHTTDNELRYAMLTYQDAGATVDDRDSKYVPGTDTLWTNPAQTGKIDGTGYDGYGSGEGGGSSGMARTNGSLMMMLKLVVDDESGMLALHQDDPVCEDNATAKATTAALFNTGDKRIAFVIYIPTSSGMNINSSYPVLDLNMYMQGGSLANHAGGNEYTASFKDFGINAAF